jgi:hypothetical protein
MKAISLWQPWASAIAAGIKTMETRHWTTNYRGPLAIHAAKRWTNEELYFWQKHVANPENVEDRDAFRKIGILSSKDLPRGAIVATCDLCGVISTDDDPNITAPAHVCSSTELTWGNYSSGRFAWLLSNINLLKQPIPCIGRQGFFDWKPDEA